jgi:hypothetical protein
MKNIIISTIASIALSFIAINAAWSEQPKNEIFIVKSTKLSMDEVVSAVKSFAKKKKWVYLGAEKG